MIVKNLVFLLIVFVGFGVSLASSQIVNDASKSLDETVVDSGEKMIHAIEETKIEDGSMVSNTEVTITINGDVNKKCTVKLIDSILNEIKISDEFVCQGTQVITLTKEGNDALTFNNIEKKPMEFSVEFNDNTKIKPVFTLTRYKVDYVTPTYFVKVENNTVIDIIVADQLFVNSLNGQWIETAKDDSFRGKYAGIGDTYDTKADMFFPEINTTSIPPIDNKTVDAKK